MSTSGPFTFCTTTAHVLGSLATLKNASFLVLDCEGYELGHNAGELSLITIGTEDFSKVFVYDAVQLNHAALMPVLRLLENPGVLKIVWDGRMDFSELYYSYGVRLEHVLDLQIVEVVSRVARGESEEERVARLTNYFYSCRPRKHTYNFVGIQTLVGMQRCLRDFALAPGDGKDVNVTKMHHKNQTNMWMYRPLSDRLLAYAAKDVHLIHLIYDCFNSRRYLRDLPTLLAQSRRFVSIPAAIGSRPTSGDCFSSSPVLPLDVLVKPDSKTYQCSACRRSLSVRCFNTSYQRRTKACRVCYVVGIRNNQLQHQGWMNLI